MTAVEKGLVIREPWISMILEGRKTWEMRSGRPTYRGWIGLIRKGSGKVSGIARLAEVGEALDEEALVGSIDRHGIPEDMIRSGAIGKWVIPWKLADIRALAEPVPYRHPNGAITLFSFDPEVSAAIRAQLGEAAAPEVRPVKGGLASGQAMKVQQVDKEDSSMPTHGSGAAGRFLGGKELTAGNLAKQNQHFYLRSFLDKFPKDLIGGRDRTPQVMATVEVDGMPPVETDICPTHKFFRARGWTRRFFEHVDAEPGDRVEVYETGHLRYRVCLVKRGAV